MQSLMPSCFFFSPFHLNGVSAVSAGRDPLFCLLATSREHLFCVVKQFSPLQCVWLCSLLKGLGVFLAGHWLNVELFLVCPLQKQHRGGCICS